MTPGPLKTEAPFQADFLLDGKAVVTEEDGHLIIEGYAADFEVDREDEAFEPGAFDEGMKAFMASNPILIYHHKYDQALGEVLEWEGKAAGPWVKARVDKPEPSSPLADVYTKIKNGVIKGFSIGGRFHRRRGEDGQVRIHKCDVAELSVTPLPINPRTLFAVAGKAFGEDPDLVKAEDAIARLEAVFEKIENSLS
jgi:HK97 family phage prohead protease